MIKKDYTVPELVQNPSFQRMVKGLASFEEVENWNNWIEEKAENREKAKKAISEIVGFKFTEPLLPDLDQKLAKLYIKTSGLKRFTSQKRITNEQRLRWVIRLAVVFLVMSLVGIGIYNYSEDSNVLTHLEQMTEAKKIATDSGEQKTLTFSNGAKVILNSNSTLTYSLGVTQNQIIDVVLEGEAWFEVENNDDNKNQPVFAVRTPDGVVRDIGTKFLVTVQAGQSRVVLQEGIVEIEQVQRWDHNQKHENGIVRLNKGEMLEFNRSEILNRKRVNSTFYTSWATGFMEFDQTGILDLADFIEQRFNVNVKINTTDTEGVRLDGAVYFRSLDELVRSVSEVTGIPVYRSENRDVVYIGAA